MSDLIDRSKLPMIRLEIPECIDKKTCRILEAVMMCVQHVIDSAPRVDAVPVVRCERCRAWGKSPFGNVEGAGWCILVSEHTRPDFYCAYGVKLERKEVNTDGCDSSE